MKKENPMSEVDLLFVISGNIKSLMEEVGYNQKDLAYDTGLSEGAISNYVNGRKIPGLKAIFNMCMAFNCGIEDIVGYIDWVD